jgi:hypothetical protein
MISYEFPAQHLMSRTPRYLGLLVAIVQVRAVTLATVGDSRADAIYLGLKLQPSLLKKADIRLLRWSRPSIGLTRNDSFDYAAWMRDTDELGRADVCLAELGANDLQGIRVAVSKWIQVGSDTWRTTYRARVKAFVEILKATRCGAVFWLLQPAKQPNPYLSQYRDMINRVQLEAAAPGADGVFEIMAATSDYSSDGIHFNKTFCFALARASADLAVSWKTHLSCSSCHSKRNTFFRWPPAASELFVLRPQ